MTKGCGIKYTDVELSWIKANCKRPRNEAHQEFCVRFNRDVNLANYKAICNRNGWLTGRTGLYEKGRTPENKGQKMPYNANSAKHQFKKGNKPHNTKYIGHERIDTKDGYIYLNIAKKGSYVLKHRYLWEKENGKLPDGMALKCLDGNRLNTCPSNWEAIPRAALPFLNGRYNGNNYDKMPDELKPVVLTLAKVRASKAKLIKKRRQNEL